MYITESELYETLCEYVTREIIDFIKNFKSNIEPSLNVIINLKNYNGKFLINDTIEKMLIRKIKSELNIHKKEFNFLNISWSDFIKKDNSTRMYFIKLGGIPIVVIEHKLLNVDKLLLLK